MGAAEQSRRGEKHRVSALGFAVCLPTDACWSCDKRDLTGRQRTFTSSRLAPLSGEYATITTVENALDGVG
jgi:hypothetical protein